MVYNNKPLTEQDLLRKSSRFVDYDNKRGYFPFAVANELVTKYGWKFWQSSSWGYILEK
jgi:hypothetical protein